MLKKIIGKNQIIERLLQLYLHNISLYFPIDMDQKTGLYKYENLDSYLEGNKNKIAYLIEYENNIAGFILVEFTNVKNIIQEMFVINNYKRKGVGSMAVKELFDKHRGNWEIKSVPLSNQAESFWKNTIKKYTNNNFDIKYIGKYNRAVITFKND